MKKTRKSTKLSFAFKHTGEVDVTVSLGKTLPSVKYLNAQALSRASRATIDVGSVKGESCVRRVLAVIESGIVKKLAIEPCGEMVRPTLEQEALIKAALKIAGKKVRPKWKPVPVAKFLSNAQAYLIDGPFCLHICAFGYCVECCLSDIDLGDYTIPYICIAGRNVRET